MAESTTTTAAAIIEKRVSALLTETLIQEMVSLRTVRDFSSQVGMGMDRLDIPLFNELAVQDVSETAEVTPQTISPSTAQLPLNRHKSIPFFVSDRLSAQGKVNVVTEAVNNGAKSLAAEMDDYIFGLIDANASTAAPDHRIALTANEPLTDMANAKKLLDDQNVPKSGRYIAASPGFVQSILADSNVINVDKYGSQDPIQAGFVSRIYGFTIVESSSSSIIDDGFQAYHESAIGFARQLQPQLKNEYKVLKHGFDYSLSHLYGAIATDSNGLRAVVYDADGA